MCLYLCVCIYWKMRVYKTLKNCLVNETLFSASFIYLLIAAHAAFSPSHFSRFNFSTRSNNPRR